MAEQFVRTEMLLGEEAMQRLAGSRVAIFGIGGVGGHVMEGLARSGIGALDLIDHDRVSISNLNRQIIATMDTLDMYKTDAAASRIRSINPDCAVVSRHLFFLPETKDQFDFSSYDYVVDAIDTVTGKLALIEAAREAGTPIISAMGAGNKLDPSAFRVADIFETSVCPLAKVMRRECRRRGITSLKVVYSQEMPVTPKAVPVQEPESIDGCATSQAEIDGRGKDNQVIDGREKDNQVIDRETDNQIIGREKDSPKGKRPPGSTAFAPAVMGLIIASEVVKDLTAAHRL